MCVCADHSTFAKPPGKFEAGTPAICEAIGLGVACDYLDAIGMDALERFEHELGAYMYVISFSLRSHHPLETPNIRKKRQ